MSRPVAVQVFFLPNNCQVQPSLLDPPRRTCRLSEALNWITLARGGQAGARLARRLGLLVSGSTLLRQLRRRARRAPVVAPRVLGIDDWAWRKGHRYGTILCDLESRKVIDLLPDRESGTVAAWLRKHPGSKIVSRDRGGICARGRAYGGTRSCAGCRPLAPAAQPE